MTVELPLSFDAIAPHTDLGEGLHEVRPDIAYQRLAMVNVVMVGLPDAGDWVLVDSGVAGFTEMILSASDRRFAGRRPRAIIQTHGHFDHVGSLLELSERWNVPVYVHEAEAPFLNGTGLYPPPDSDADGGLLPRLAPFFPRRAVNVGERLVCLPADGAVPPLPEGWLWVATPGHTPGHISLWREGDRTLIAGDAVITTGQESVYEVTFQTPEMHGPPRYLTPDWLSSAESVRKLARLEPELLLTGHGRAMAGPAMREALHQLAEDFERIGPPLRLRAELAQRGQ